MISLKDQINHLVQLQETPKRIISLVPSQTELLHDLGLESSVIGITKFCVYPENWGKSKAIVGGTKNLHHDKIAKLKPDFIIANKEENTKEDIQELQKHYPVYTSDIYTINESFKMMRDVGVLLNKSDEASRLIKSINYSFESLRNRTGQTVAYLIWQKPYMLAGKHTFIQSMLNIAGFENVLTSNTSRYPEVTIAELKKLDPDVIFLSSEPYPFKKAHQIELEKQTGIKTILVDGEMFSWYGTRMLRFTEYVNQLNLPLVVKAIRPKTSLP